jgi:hypothetical protein
MHLVLADAPYRLRNTAHPDHHDSYSSLIRHIFLAQITNQ